MDHITVKEPGFSEVVEKKSRFLGEVVPAATKEEAEEYINKVRKRHYDARHHCFAYIVGEPGSVDEITRAGDDGEPQGTAGRPILDIMTAAGLHRSLIVVTRYFGGTLLGTGGLVRAYSEAAQAALKDAKLLRIREGVLLRIECGYDAYGKLSYSFGGRGLYIKDSIFGEKVTMELIVPPGDIISVKREILDLTEGKCVMEEDGLAYYEEQI